MSRIEGSWARWVHEHPFLEDGDETLAIDRVHSNPPAGFLGRLAHRMFVHRDLEAIFSHRAEQLTKVVGEPQIETPVGFEQG